MGMMLSPGAGLVPAPSHVNMRAKTKAALKVGATAAEIL
jgi:hypothetical protein